MSKKTIAIITVIGAVLLIILFIFLRAKKDITTPENVPTEEPMTEYHLKIEKPTIVYSNPTAESEIPTVPPTLNGKPILSTTEVVKESESVYINPLINESIDISINGILVENINTLHDFYQTGYRLDEKAEQSKLQFKEVNNPYLSNTHNKNDQIMVMIQNTNSVSCLYPDCKIKKIMCDFSKCKANIYVGKHHIDSLNPYNLIKYFGSPQSFLKEERSTYISYQAKNLQFFFEFENEKIISLGIGLS